MNIKKITIKNFLSLVDVVIEPGKVTQIVGDNGHGKTSILKALGFAVQGSNDPTLVRLGEDSAEVLVELSDETLIRRRLNSQGRQSVDVTRDGMKAQSPQALLGALFDSSVFEPMQLLSKENFHTAIMSSIDLKLDAATLSAAIGVSEKDLPELDYGLHGLKVLDLCHAYFYQRRKEANSDAKDKKNRWETYQKDFKAVETPKMQRKEIELRRESCITVIAQCDGLIDRAGKQKTQIEKAEKTLKTYREERQKIVDNLAALGITLSTIAEDSEEKIKRLKAKYEEDFKAILAAGERSSNDVKEKIATEKGRIETSDKFIAEAEAAATNSTEVLDVTQFQKDKTEAQQEIETLKTEKKAIEAYEATQRSQAMLDGMKEEFIAAEAFAEALDARVQLLAGKVKQDLMSSAKMPIDGLEYVEGNFLVSGVSVPNLNTAARMRLSLAVARTKAKKTKAICIDGVEAWDSETWKAFNDETEKDEFEYFVTKVGAPHVSPTGTVVTMQKGQVLQ